MKTDIKKKWVKALRTGRIGDRKIEQTHDVLRRADKDGVEQLCCLGVLTELAILDGVDVIREGGDGTYEYKYFDDELGNYADHVGDLPPTVVAWAGLDSSNPRLLVEDSEEGIAASVLNDDHGKSFKEIADLVKKSL